LRPAAALSCCCLAIASAVPAAVARPSLSTFDALTAPPSTLPAGCAIVPAASERQEGGRVTGGL
jgi:hypothetical protein